MPTPQAEFKFVGDQYVPTGRVESEMPLEGVSTVTAHDVETPQGVRRFWVPIPREWGGRVPRAIPDGTLAWADANHT